MVPSARPEVARGARARKIVPPGRSSKKMPRVAAGRERASLPRVRHPHAHRPDEPARLEAPERPPSRSSTRCHPPAAWKWTRL
eukprot:4196668-Prymnesium_polylepis.1